ncbi:uroporphyrinogen-III C-methyltransferase [archaeon SCG-AAA382B04]|nr:uroporphyrinogen-III C-methyltransferase [archaeon SCG-AAA382B04]
MGGKVYLIGAGPSKDLVTLAGLKAIKKSDVIVHDRLIDKEVLNKAKEDAELIDAGKKKDKHKLTQEEIEEVLIQKALEGNIVSRIKGGDPFLFGRGGEEVKSLRQNDISYKVIPGVTSAIAAPSKYGVPVTHRGLASSAVFVTGHEDPTKEEKSVDWPKISNAGTIVVLMGVGNLPQIVEKIKETKSEETPVASFEKVYSEEERVVHGRLKNIKEIAKEENLEPPAVTVVGNVVSLGEFWEEK